MSRAIGQVTTAAQTTVLVGGTFNEQTSGARRSLASSSANDTALGTGIRTVTIKYLTLSSAGVILGPYYETIALAGTAAVSTVANDIALVERMYGGSAGSGGTAAGTITLYAAPQAQGAQLTAIATGQASDFNAVHYVASDKQCFLLDLEAIGGDAGVALVDIRRLLYGMSIERLHSGQYGCTSTLPRGVSFPDGPKLPILGPCRLRMAVTPANSNGQTTRASFGFYDVSVGLPPYTL
jgi:hypothetical protein